MNNYIPPVLFCIFNRLEYTKQSFAKIQKAKPSKLFVAADGPRKGNKKDYEDCKKTRDWVTNNINWDCEVKFLFSGRNLGCSPAMKSAIDWFFSNVEEGIILEDDCVVSDSFFSFCGVMLEKYRSEERIMVITGLGLVKSDRYDYVFGKGRFNEFAIATWRRAWLKNDDHLGKWLEYKKQDVFNFDKDQQITNYLYKMLEDKYNNSDSCWGNIFICNVIMNNGLFISPTVNMVNNVGAVGVHFQTKDDIKKHSHLLNQETSELDIDNLRHPDKIEPSKEIVNIFYQRYKKQKYKNLKGINIFQFVKKNKKLRILRYGLFSIVIWELLKLVIDQF